MGLGSLFKRNKKNKKEKDKKTKKQKGEKRYKKETSENIDEFLLGSAGRLEGGFKEYKEESLDWSWDSIMSGGK